MPGYVYKGGQPYVPGKDRTDYKPRQPLVIFPAMFDPSLCGDMRGYRQHRKHGQQQCRRCQDAQNKYHAEYVARKKGGG